MTDLIPGIGTPLGGLAQAQQFFGRRKLRKAGKHKQQPSSQQAQEAGSDEAPVVFIAKAGRVCATPDCGTVLSAANIDKFCRHCQAAKRAARFKRQVLQAAKGIPAHLLPAQQKQFAALMGVTASGRRT